MGKFEREERMSEKLIQGYKYVPHVAFAEGVYLIRRGKAIGVRCESLQVLHYHQFVRTKEPAVCIGVTRRGKTKVHFKRPPRTKITFHFTHKGTEYL